MVIVREAEQSDSDYVSYLYRQVWKDFKKEMPRQLFDDRTPPSFILEEWFTQDRYFIAEEFNRIVGVVGCRIEHDACLMMHLVVDPETREQGVGSLLIEQVILYARSVSANKVWLDTLPTLDVAIYLYKKFGFEKVGTLKKHYWGADVDLYELLL